MDFAVINRFSDGPVLGFTYFAAEEKTDYTELNIYLLFIILHFKFYSNEQ
jgi:hypothetical protein